MSQFYCRDNELRKLNKRYAGDKFECIVIYGRRRIGKTALINEFSVRINPPFSSPH
ncbi:MAG: ATP-binding protein [Lachnospiraceae bacterium]